MYKHLFFWIFIFNVCACVVYEPTTKTSRNLTTRERSNFLFYSHHDFLCVCWQNWGFFMWKDYPLIDFMAEVIPLVDDECFVVVVLSVYNINIFFQVFFSTIESQILWCVESCQNMLFFLRWEWVTHASKRFHTDV